MDPAARPLLLPASLLGWALSGFFDGIVLHQLLQWHHLLSLVPGAGLQAARAQILADGLFHLAMYGFACAGLHLLWRRRGALAAAGPRPALLGGLALGFGLWHLVDAVASHWILGIHRIRVDVSNPLVWDLGWLAIFGLPPLPIAAVLLRRPVGGGPAAGLAVALALGVTGAGAVASRPAPGVDTALVLFPPGTPGGAAFDAIDAAGARALSADPALGIWAVALGGGSAAAERLDLLLVLGAGFGRGLGLGRPG